MNEFRVNVTPEQSRIVQETLFKLGYKWYSGANEVKHTSESVLCISPIDKDITYSSYRTDSNMTFEQFKEKYMEFELPENWYVIITDDNKEILENWRKKQPDCDLDYNIDRAVAVTSNNYDNSYLFYSLRFNDQASKCTKITFKQFKKYVLKEETMELKITKERVLEAANSCAQAKGVLKKIFPEVFEDDKYLNIPPIINEKKQILYTKEGKDIIWSSLTGNFKEKGFYLISEYDWNIVIDDERNKILVPTKK